VNVRIKKKKKFGSTKKTFARGLSGRGGGGERGEDNCAVFFEFFKFVGPRGAGGGGGGGKPLLFPPRGGKRTKGGGAREMFFWSPTRGGQKNFSPALFGFLGAGGCGGGREANWFFLGGLPVFFFRFGFPFGMCSLQLKKTGGGGDGGALKSCAGGPKRLFVLVGENPLCRQQKSGGIEKNSRGGGGGTPVVFPRDCFPLPKPEKKTPVAFTHVRGVFVLLNTWFCGVGELFRDVCCAGAGGGGGKLNNCFFPPGLSWGGGPLFPRWAELFFQGKLLALKTKKKQPFVGFPKRRPKVGRGPGFSFFSRRGKMHARFCPPQGGGGGGGSYLVFSVGGKPGGDHTGISNLGSGRLASRTRGQAVLGDSKAGGEPPLLAESGPNGGHPHLLNFFLPNFSKKKKQNPPAGWGGPLITKFSFGIFFFFPPNRLGPGGRGPLAYCHMDQAAGQKTPPLGRGERLVFRGGQGGGGFIFFPFLLSAGGVVGVVFKLLPNRFHFFPGDVCTLRGGGKKPVETGGEGWHPKGSRGPAGENWWGAALGIFFHSSPNFGLSEKHFLKGPGARFFLPPTSKKKIADEFFLGGLSTFIGGAGAAQKRGG